MSFIMTHNIPLQKVFFNHYIFIYLKQIFILMTFKSVIADHFWGNVMRYNIVYFDYLYKWTSFFFLMSAGSLLQIESVMLGLQTIFIL